MTGQEILEAVELARRGYKLWVKMTAAALSERGLSDREIISAILTSATMGLKDVAESVNLTKADLIEALNRKNS